MKARNTGTFGAALQTIPYTYADSNWKDKLTSYNGQTITYDAIGNPLTDGTWTYEWAAGRQLRQMAKSGTTIQFKYDHNGLRVGKVVNGVETKYILHGRLVTHLAVGADNLHFFYDAQSRPAKISYNGTIYTYIHNLQGDVVGLLDSSDALVVEYKYDAWGRPIATTGSLAATLGRLNPFRYRGYVYDVETELYYLRSRYYDPSIGRFVNADEFIAVSKNILDHDLFTYCINTPINAIDEEGHWSISHIGLAFMVTNVAVRIVVPAVGAELQLYANRLKAKKAIRDTEERQLDYLVNYPYGGAENAIAEGILGKYIWFYEQVNHCAPMDYKVDERKPWWAEGCDKFYFRGKMITLEEYGNINYGYVGKALGIDDWILFAGGGFAAITHKGDTSWHPEYFFDSEEDHANIAWGISIYNDTWANE